MLRILTVSDEGPTQRNHPARSRLPVHLGALHILPSNGYALGYYKARAELLSGQLSLREMRHARSQGGNAKEVAQLLCKFGRLSDKYGRVKGLDDCHIPIGDQAQEPND